MASDYNALTVYSMGLISASGGALLRDCILNKIPTDDTGFLLGTFAFGLVVLYTPYLTKLTKKLTHHPANEESYRTKESQLSEITENSQ